MSLIAVVRGLLHYDSKELTMIFRKSTIDQIPTPSPETSVVGRESGSSTYDSWPFCAGEFGSVVDFE